jgi:hypothetical protein
MRVVTLMMRAALIAVKKRIISINWRKTMNLVEALKVVLTLATSGSSTYDQPAQQEALDQVRLLMEHRGKPAQFCLMNESEYRDRLYAEYELTTKLQKALEVSRTEKGVAEKNLSVTKSQLASSRTTVTHLRDKIAEMQLAVSPRVVKLIKELAEELQELNDE